MNSHTPYMPLRRGRTSAGAFTLVELLVVVGILGLLMAMLAPSVHQAVVVTRRRTVCGFNVGAIAKACSLYAADDAKGRLPNIFRIDLNNSKRNKPGFDKWGDVREGNPAALWLLVERDKGKRRAFLCPEALTERGWKEPPEGADGFDVEMAPGGKTAAMSTISYSYITTTRNEDWSEAQGDNMAMERQMADMLTRRGVPPTLVIIGDQNPRCTIGKTKMNMTRAQFNDAAEGKDRKARQARNSLNHRRLGQNLGRTDGSVRWETGAFNADTEDNVYTSGVDSEKDDRMGRRKDPQDTFLIP